jgi:hypothetical protein
MSVAVDKLTGFCYNMVMDNKCSATNIYILGLLYTKMNKIGINRRRWVDRQKATPLTAVSRILGFQRQMIGVFSI